VGVSFFSVFRCFKAREGATLGISYATIQVGLTREAGNRSINENRAIFVVYPYDISAPAEFFCFLISQHRGILYAEPLPV